MGAGGGQRGGSAAEGWVHCFSSLDPLFLWCFNTGTCLYQRPYSADPSGLCQFPHLASILLKQVGNKLLPL